MAARRDEIVRSGALPVDRWIRLRFPRRNALVAHSPPKRSDAWPRAGDAVRAGHGGPKQGPEDRRPGPSGPAGTHGAPQEGAAHVVGNRKVALAPAAVSSDRPTVFRRRGCARPSSTVRVRARVAALRIDTRERRPMERSDS
jgi:hypothetical protein